MFAYLVKIVGNQGAITIISCLVTVAAQFVVLYLGFVKFKKEIRFSSYHQKQLEVLGEVYRKIAITRASANSWTLISRTHRNLWRNKRILEVGTDTLNFYKEYCKYYKTNLIYIPQEIRQLLVDFERIINDGILKHAHSLKSGDEIMYSKTNIAEFITEADKVLNKLDNNIRKIIANS
jgi:hypothetical protein